jgi:hypothetical protein
MPLRKTPRAGIHDRTRGTIASHLDGGVGLRTTIDPMTSEHSMNAFSNMRQLARSLAPIVVGNGILLWIVLTSDVAMDDMIVLVWLELIAVLVVAAASGLLLRALGKAKGFIAGALALCYLLGLLEAWPAFDQFWWLLRPEYLLAEIGEPQIGLPLLATALGLLAAAWDRDAQRLGNDIGPRLLLMLLAGGLVLLFPVAVLLVAIYLRDFSGREHLKLARWEKWALFVLFASVLGVLGLFVDHGAAPGNEAMLLVLFVVARLELELLVVLGLSLWPDRER